MQRRSRLFWGWLTLTFKVKFNLNHNLSRFELVCTTTCQPFKLESPIDLVTSEHRYSPWITTIFTIPTTVWIVHAHVRVLHSQGTDHPIGTDHLTWVGSSLLDSSMLLLFCQPIKSPLIVFTSCPTCILVHTQLQSVQWPWKTDFFLNIGHEPRTTSNPASSCWLLWLLVNAQWLEHSTCSRKYVT